MHLVLCITSVLQVFYKHFIVNNMHAANAWQRTAPHKTSTPLFGNVLDG